jgi:hypothetical protein
MIEHKYIIGQRVGLKCRFGMLPRGTHLFTVSQRVMLEDLPPQYRIISKLDGGSLIVTESDIELVKE